MRINKLVSKRESVQESNAPWMLSGFSLFFHSPSGYKSLTKKIVSHWSHSSPPSQSNLRCWFFRPSGVANAGQVEIRNSKLENVNRKLEIWRSKPVLQQKEEKANKPNEAKRFYIKQIRGKAEKQTQLH